MGMQSGPLRALLLFLFLIPVAHAARLGSWILCAESCQNSFRSVLFNDTQPTASDLERSCESILGLSSTYLCLEIYCGQEYRRLALQEQNETCQSTLGVSIPSFSIVADLRHDNASAIRRIDETDDFDTLNPAVEVVIPSLEFFTTWYNTLDGWAYAERWHFLFGAATVAFWVLVVLVGMLNRIHLLFCRMRNYRKDTYLQKASFGTQKWFQSRIILPATFGYRCAKSVMWSTIPPRVQSLTILVFLGLNIVFTILGYRVTQRNFYFNTPLDQLLRCVSDRTGIISFASFPIIWLFGMRNNVAIWLTGWDFGTYNSFHRWTARIATVEAIIHSVGYTIFVFRDGGLDNLVAQFADWYWNAGILATIFMGLLLPFSIYWIRRRHYELFLVVHIILSLAVLLAMLGHVSIFDGQYDVLFWVPVYIWVFDRVLRACRIGAFNLQSWGTDSVAIYDASSNVVQLTIPVDATSTFLCQPGTYYYLMVLDDARCWESHPFTVASIPNSSDTKDCVDERAPLLRYIETQSCSHSVAGLTDNQMTFLIRPYDSFTARLKDLAIKSGRVKVLVEGPYGHTHSIHRYDHVVFVVGGTGIVTLLSYLPLLLGNYSTPKTIEIHWAVREVALAATIFREYMDTAFNNSKLSFDLYMSAGTDEVSEYQLPSQVVQHHKRPNISNIIESAALQNGYGTMAIVACGPEGLVDDARAAAVTSVRSSNSHIDYFQDNFFW